MAHLGGIQKGGQIVNVPAWALRSDYPAGYWPIEVGTVTFTVNLDLTLLLKAYDDAGSDQRLIEAIEQFATARRALAGVPETLRERIHAAISELVRDRKK